MFLMLLEKLKQKVGNRERNEWYKNDCEKISKMKHFLKPIAQTQDQLLTIPIKEIQDKAELLKKSKQKQ